MKNDNEQGEDDLFVKDRVRALSKKFLKNKPKDKTCKGEVCYKLRYSGR